MALAPSVGSSPACAATPLTSMSKNPTPFRAVLSAPLELGSKTSTAAASAQVLSIVGRELGLPTSSSPLRSNRTGGRGRSNSSSARRDQTGLDQPCLHVEYPGSGNDVAIEGEGQLSESPKRPDRVVVRQERNGMARPRPVHYGSGAVGSPIYSLTGHRFTESRETTHDSIHIPTHSRER